MEKTKKQLLAEGAKIEAALAVIADAESKAEQAKERAILTKWCQALAALIDGFPSTLEMQGWDGECLTMHLVSARALLERLLAEDRDA